MINQTLTAIKADAEELKAKGRTKIQSLLNCGYSIFDSNGTLAGNANRIITALEKDDIYTLTVPEGECICLKVSDMVLHLLKPYLKDLFHIGQKATKSNYILFRYNAEFLAQLEPLRESNEQIQLIDSFEIAIKKTTLPTFTNRARLYKVSKAPMLKSKELSKILELHKTIVENNNGHSLLSANISHQYNMPQNILRISGYNVLSLKALNLLELLLIFATNSTAIYRHASDNNKPFIIPSDFINHVDFNLNLTSDEIIKPFEELVSVGIIDEFSISKDKFIVESNLIEKSIKQYSYTQTLHHYKNMGLHQQSYVYTFLNHLRYLKNIPQKKDSATPNQVGMSLESLIYNLELSHYMHDFNRLSDVLGVLLQEGVKQGLLIMPINPQPITSETVKYLFNFRDKLHELFVLNQNEPMANMAQKPYSTYFDCKETATHYANGRLKPKIYQEVAQIGAKESLNV